MTLLNASYEVLSDPRRRALHDRWIAEQAAVAEPVFRKSSPEASNPSAQADRQTATTPQGEVTRTSAARWLKLRGWAILIALPFIILVIRSQHQSPAVTNSLNQASAPSAPKKELGADQFLDGPTGNDNTNTKAVAAKLVKLEVGDVSNGYRYLGGDPSTKASWAEVQPPDFSKHGTPLPAGYLEGRPVLNTDGLSTVTIDNTRNSSAVIVKLADTSHGQRTVVRTLYIPNGDKFIVDQLTAGIYELRYRDVQNNSVARMDPFQVREIVEDNGTRFSDITVTLYKVRNGNMKTYPNPRIRVLTSFPRSSRGMHLPYPGAPGRGD